MNARSRDELMTNNMHNSSKPYSTFDQDSQMKNSRSTASYLRADIQKLKEEHLFHNLSKQIESTSKLLNLSQDEKDDTLSTADRYDLKAYQFN